MKKTGTYFSVFDTRSIRASLVLCVLFCVCLFLISCETKSNSDRNSTSSNTTLTYDESSDLKLPPTGDQTVQGKLKGMKGLKGVNVDQLFSQNIRDTDKRFDRLEDAVVDFRREFEDIKPEIVRLVAIEKDIQTLIDMMSQDLNLPPSAPEFANNVNDPIPTMMQDNQSEQPISLSTNAPNVEMTPKPVQSVVPPAVQLSKLRSGEHETFTRIVLDATGKTPYNVILSADGTSLKMTIPSSAWNGSASKNFSNSLLSSFTANSTQSGETIVNITFKQPVIMIKEDTLSSTKAPYFRIFVDVRAK